MSSTKSIAREILTEGAFSGIFPGWGASRIVALNYENSNNVQILADSSVNASKEENPNKHRKEAKLNTLFSISIAGCDLMGSALYTAGTCAANSGKFAPVGLFLVTSMLFLFRKVYSEVVTAIPVNGGTYNLMLNTTTKKMAGFVACLSILSYTATAILSAFDAVVYMAELWETVDVRLFSVLILLFFGVVTICGVKESAQVTCAMFLVHMFALTLLILWGFAHGCKDNFSLFSENLRTPVPTIYDSSNNLLARRNPAAAIFFGYSSGLLGITGFETASNYVEDLADTSVFVSTVNWMWILVGIYNPLLSLMSMMVLPMQTIYDHPSDMLAEMAGELGGYGFKAFLCADAIFILCGGVLTALVGVSGLLGRLAKDRVLPEVFGYTNAGGSYYIAITIFVIVAVTLFLAIYDPEDPTAINNFGGVFAISFLSVLTAFGCGSVLLKLYRPRIARLVIANWWQIIVSTLAVFAGLIGNIVLTPSVFYLFLAYLAGFLAVVTYMFLRVEILTFGIWMIRKVCMSTEKKQKEAKKEENIVQACLTQYQYDEDQQVQQVVVNRKELKAAAKKSIFLQQTRSVLSEKKEEVNIEMISMKSDSSAAIESPSSRSILPNRADAGSGGFFSFASPTKKRTNSAEESEITGKKENKTSGTPHHHSLSALDLIEFVQKRMSSLQIYSPVRYFDRNSSQSLDEIQMLLQRPILGKYLQYLMTSLDELVSVPFVYLAKNSDPISLLLAVNYIDNNELSNNIYILHFVDDRKAITAYREYEAEVAEHTRTTSTDSSPPYEENSSNAPNHGFLLNMFMKPGSDASSAPSLTVAKDAFTLNAALPTLPHDTQQLLHNVAVLDAFYTYKKIHAVVIRGGFFSPACLDCVANYLGLRKNNMIMGVPDQKFPFPFAKLGGCRIAIPDADSNVRQQASSHLRTVFNTIHSHSPDLHHTDSKLGTDEETKSDIHSDVYSNPLVKEDSRPLFDQQQLDV